MSVFPVPVSSTAEPNAIITMDTTDNKSAINHRCAISELLENLQSIEKLQSIHDVVRVNSIVDHLLLHLPGPITPEKLCRIDLCSDTNWMQIAECEYLIVQNHLIRLFDDEWPINTASNNQPEIIMQNVLNLFSIDHSVYFVKTTISNIFKRQNHQKFEILVKLFESCIRNDTWLLAAFIDLCYAGNQVETIYDTDDRDQLIQLLIAAPNKIANYFMGKHSNLFDTERFSCALLLALIQALYFIAEKNKVEQTTMFNVQFLGQLFGRIAVDFNLNRTSKVLPEIFRILSLLAKKSAEYKTTVQQMLIQVHRTSYDIIAWYVLNTENPVDLLGDAVITSADWAFVLKTKMALSPPGGVTEHFIRQFIGYLSTNLPFDDKCSVYEDVAKKWSSKLSLKINSIDQHLYFTKLLVIGAKLFKIEQNKSFAEKLSLVIHNGVRNHIEILDEKMRAIGMITAEIILNKFSSHDDEESKLHFEYDGFGQEAKQLVENIKQFDQCIDTNEPHRNEYKNEPDTDLEDSIAVLYNILNEKDVEKPKESRNTSKPSSLSNVQNTAIEIGSLEPSSSARPVLATPKEDFPDDDDLDSDDDDDLQPYDMSNDTPLVEAKRPRYLQDISESLLETDDSDIFEQAIISCTSLIELKLPNDDSNIGVELLRLLIEIDERFHVEDFDYHRMSSCVAICCIKPKDSAEFLCKQIHAELGKYSIGKKVLMMEILSESAKTLAKLTRTRKKSPEKNVPSERKYSLLLFDDEAEANARLNEAKQIVQARLERKTRRFARPSMNHMNGAKPNEFAEVAGSFFFPLLYGIGKDDLKFHGMDNALKDDTDNILLLNLIRTIGTITFACQNCPIISRVTPEVLQLGFALRFHAESKIRLAVLQMLAAALLATPKSLLQHHSSAYLLEMKVWLEEYLSFNIIKGETNEECRKMAQNVYALCIDALIADV